MSDPATKLCGMQPHAAHFQADDASSILVTRSTDHSVDSDAPRRVSRPARSTKSSNQANPPALLLSLGVVVLVLLLVAAFRPASADARPVFRYGVASSYGPGLYGNGTACGQTLRPSTRGVAHRWLPCGTRLQLCRSGRCTHARVIDRGPFVAGRVLDLTAATTRELCSCSPYAWGHRTVAYRRAAR